MAEADISGLLSKIGEILNRELGRIGARVTQDRDGFRCVLPRTRGILIVSISAVRVSWETIPTLLNESIGVSNAEEWDSAIKLLELQVRDWRGDAMRD